jgi:hypothetical protein
MHAYANDQLHIFSVSFIFYGIVASCAQPKLCRRWWNESRFEDIVSTRAALRSFLPVKTSSIIEYWKASTTDDLSRIATLDKIPLSKILCTKSMQKLQLGKSIRQTLTGGSSQSFIPTHEHENMEGAFLSSSAPQVLVILLKISFLKIWYSWEVSEGSPDVQLYETHQNITNPNKS